MPKNALISDLSTVQGIAVGMVAKAAFAILGGNSARIWPDQAPFCCLRRGEEGREVGDKVAPWKHLEQVASGPFRVRNRQPSTAGIQQRSDKSSTRPGKGSEAARWLKPRKPWWEKRCFPWHCKKATVDLSGHWEQHFRRGKWLCNVCYERLFYLWIIVLSRSDVLSTWPCLVCAAKWLVPKLQALSFSGNICPYDTAWIWQSLYFQTRG